MDERITEGSKMSDLYVKVYDAADDETYLKPIAGDIPVGVVPFTAEEAKATGLPIRE
jgi:hypothetical protein